jgi:hypothetical protein
MAESVLERIKAEARRMKQGGLAATPTAPLPTGPRLQFPEQPEPHERPFLERLVPEGENRLFTAFAAPFRTMAWLGDQESRYVIEPFYGFAAKQLARQMEVLPEPVARKAGDVAGLIEKVDIPFLPLAILPTDEVKALSDPEVRRRVLESGARDAYKILADKSDEYYWRTQLLSPVTVASLALTALSGGAAAPALGSKAPLLARVPGLARAAGAASEAASGARALPGLQRAARVIKIPFDLYDEAYATLLRPYVWLTKDVAGRTAWWGVKTAGQPLLRPVRSWFEQSALSKRIQESRLLGSVMRRNLRETGRAFAEDYDRIVQAENEAIASGQVSLDQASDPQLLRYWTRTQDQNAAQVLLGRGLIDPQGKLTPEAEARLKLDDELVRHGRFGSSERTLAQQILSLVYRVTVVANPNRNPNELWRAVSVRKISDGSILRGEIGTATVGKGKRARQVYEIRLGKDADITTLAHEFAHLLDFMAPEAFRNVLLRNFGEIGSGGAPIWTDRSAERFALAFEQWLFTGSSRVPEIDQMMRAFRDQAELSYFRATPGVEMPEEVARAIEDAFGSQPPRAGRGRGVRPGPQPGPGPGASPGAPGEPRPSARGVTDQIPVRMEGTRRVAEEPVPSAGMQEAVADAIPLGAPQAIPLPAPRAAAQVSTQEAVQAAAPPEPAAPPTVVERIKRQARRQKAAEARTVPVLPEPARAVPTPEPARVVSAPEPARVVPVSPEPVQTVLPPVRDVPEPELVPAPSAPEARMPVEDLEFEVPDGSPDFQDAFRQILDDWQAEFRAILDSEIARGLPDDFGAEEFLDAWLDSVVAFRVLDWEQLTGLVERQAAKLRAMGRPDLAERMLQRLPERMSGYVPARTPAEIAQEIVVRSKRSGFRPVIGPDLRSLRRRLTEGERSRLKKLKDGGLTQAHVQAFLDREFLPLLEANLDLSPVRGAVPEPETVPPPGPASVREAVPEPELVQETVPAQDVRPQQPQREVPVRETVPPRGTETGPEAVPESAGAVVSLRAFPPGLGRITQAQIQSLRRLVRQLPEFEGDPGERLLQMAQELFPGTERLEDLRGDQVEALFEYVKASLDSDTLRKARVQNTIKKVAELRKRLLGATTMTLQRLPRKDREILSRMLRNARQFDHDEMAFDRNKAREVIKRFLEREDVSEEAKTFLRSANKTASERAGHTIDNVSVLLDELELSQDRDALLDSAYRWVRSWSPDELEDRLVFTLSDTTPITVYGTSVMTDANGLLLRVLREKGETDRIEAAVQRAIERILSLSDAQAEDLAMSLGRRTPEEYTRIKVPDDEIAGQIAQAIRERLSQVARVPSPLDRLAESIDLLVPVGSPKTVREFGQILGRELGQALDNAEVASLVSELRSRGVIRIDGGLVFNAKETPTVRIDQAEIADELARTVAAEPETAAERVSLFPDEKQEAIIGSLIAELADKRLGLGDAPGRMQFDALLRNVSEGLRQRRIQVTPGEIRELAIKYGIVKGYTRSPNARMSRVVIDWDAVEELSSVAPDLRPKVDPETLEYDVAAMAAVLRRTFLKREGQESVPVYISRAELHDWADEAAALLQRDPGEIEQKAFESGLLKKEGRKIRLNWDWIDQVFETGVQKFVRQQDVSQRTGRAFVPGERQRPLDLGRFRLREDTGLRDVLDAIAVRHGGIAPERVDQVAERIRSAIGDSPWFPFTSFLVDGEAEQALVRAMRDPSKLDEGVAQALSRMGMRASLFGVKHPGLGRVLRSVLPNQFGPKRTATGSAALLTGRSLSERELEVLRRAASVEKLREAEAQYLRDKQRLGAVWTEIKQRTNLPGMPDWNENVLTVGDIWKVLDGIGSDAPADVRKLADEAREILKRWDLLPKRKRPTFARAYKNYLKFKIDELPVRTDLDEAFIRKASRIYFEHLEKVYGVDTTYLDRLVRTVIPKPLRDFARGLNRFWRQLAVLSVANVMRNVQDIYVRAHIYGFGNQLRDTESAFRRAAEWEIGGLPGVMIEPFHRFGVETEEFEEPIDLVATRLLRKVPGVGEVPADLLQWAADNRWQIIALAESAARGAAWKVTAERHFAENVLPAVVRRVRELGLGDEAVRSIERYGLDLNPSRMREIAQRFGAGAAQAEELATMVRAGIAEADRLGQMEAYRIFFDYQDVRRIEKELGLNAWLPFHYWATRNIPFYLDTLASHPRLLAFLVRYESASRRFREERDLPGKFAFMLPFGIGGGYFGVNPFAIFSIFDQFRGYPELDDESGTLQRLYDLGATIGITPSPFVMIPIERAGLVEGRFQTRLVPRLTQWVQTGTALAGLNQGRGYDPEAPVLRALTGQDPDEVRQYLVRRRIRELSLERTGRPDSPQYQFAMLDPSSPIYQEALRDVNEYLARRSFLSFFLGLPTAEAGRTEMAIRQRRGEYPSELTEEQVRYLARTGDPGTAYWGISSPEQVQVSTGFLLDRNMMPGWQHYYAPELQQMMPDFLAYLAWLRTRGPGQDRSVEAFRRERK